MKSKFHLTRLLIVTAVIGIIASFAHAGPGPQYWRAMTESAQFKKLQVGDKVAFVCYDCKTISELAIESEQARSLAKEGATVSCPSCKQVTKVVLKGSRNEPSGGRTIITYVNEKGDECAFLATVPASRN